MAEQGQLVFWDVRIPSCLGVGGRGRASLVCKTPEQAIHTECDRYVVSGAGQPCGLALWWRLKHCWNGTVRNIERILTWSCSAGWRGWLTTYERKSKSTRNTMYYNVINVIHCYNVAHDNWIGIAYFSNLETTFDPFVYLIFIIALGHRQNHFIFCKVLIIFLDRERERQWD